MKLILVVCPNCTSRIEVIQTEFFFKKDKETGKMRVECNASCPQCEAALLHKPNRKRLLR